ncbi:hypothetical protein IQ238_28360 [Pleurocapsales cyanobacterium LEGE 06147]|nr:hypothetical protein [Pleurocapsales cyanobacterium LEGE 06147]
MRTSKTNQESPAIGHQSSGINLGLTHSHQEINFLTSKLKWQVLRCLTAETARHRRAR